MKNCASLALGGKGAVSEGEPLYRALPDNILLSQGNAIYVATPSIVVHMLLIITKTRRHDSRTDLALYFRWALRE